MPEQTEADLLHLVDRAERGTLLADEATLLRAGIRRLAAARRSLGGKEAELRRLRTTQRPTAVQAGADRELAEQLRAAITSGGGHVNATLHRVLQVLRTQPNRT